MGASKVIDMKSLRHRRGSPLSESSYATQKNAFIALECAPTASHRDDKGVFPEMRDWTPGSAASSTEYDVAVVGGGLVGSALPPGLAPAPPPVIVFDAGGLAHLA